MRACSVHDLCGPSVAPIGLSPAIPTLAPTGPTLAAPTSVGRKLSWKPSASPAESINFQEITVRSGAKVVAKTLKVDRSLSSTTLSTFLLSTLPASGTVTVRACNNLGYSSESTAVAYTK
jgi:hypothetical protein